MQLSKEWKEFVKELQDYQIDAKHVGDVICALDN